MKKIIINTMMIVVAFTATAFPQTYVGNILGVGDEVLSVSARESAMGNTGVASSVGPASMFYNPANIAGMQRGMLNISAGLYPIKERVEYADEQYFINSNNYLELSDFSISYPLGTAVTIGLGRFPKYRMQYQRDKSDLIDEQKTYDFTGGVSAIDIAAAFSLGYLIDLGFGYNILSGKNSREIVYVIDEETRTTTTDTLDISGGSFDIGLRLKPGDFIKVGFLITPSFETDTVTEPQTKKEVWDSAGKEWNKISNITSDETDRIYKYPQKVGVGLSYEFWEMHRAIFNIDIVRTNWEDFRVIDPDSDTEVDPGYRNTTRVSIGVEHYLDQVMALRYGFAHEPFYGDTSCYAMDITAGVRFPITINIDIDIAGQYGLRTDFEKYLYGRKDEEVKEVNERLGMLLATMSWTF